MAEANVSPDEVAYIGDDLTDVVIMRRVGLSIATANARPEVKSAAKIVTEAIGGSGAVRESIELMLKARGVWDELLKKYEVVLLNEETSEKVGLVITSEGGPGMLHELTGVIARHHGNILSVSIIETSPQQNQNLL